MGWRRCGHGMEEVWSWSEEGVVIGWRRCGHIGWSRSEVVLCVMVRWVEEES